MLCRAPEENYNNYAEIRRSMIFGNDKLKLLLVVLLAAVALMAVTIVAKLNLWVTVAVGVVVFFAIILVALYGYGDED